MLPCILVNKDFHYYYYYYYYCHWWFYYFMVNNDFHFVCIIRIQIFGDWTCLGQHHDP